MGPKNLEEIRNPRVRSQKDKTLMWKFAMKHVPGIKNRGPDAHSRYPGSRCTDENDADEMEGAYSMTVDRPSMEKNGGNS